MKDVEDRMLTWKEIQVKNMCVWVQPIPIPNKNNS